MRAPWPSRRPGREVAPAGSEAAHPAPANGVWEPAQQGAPPACPAQGDWGSWSVTSCHGAARTPSPSPRLGPRPCPQSAGVARECGARPRHRQREPAPPGGWAWALCGTLAPPAPGSETAGSETWPPPAPEAFDLFHLHGRLRIEAQTLGPPPQHLHSLHAGKLGLGRAPRGSTPLLQGPLAGCGGTPPCVGEGFTCRPGPRIWATPFSF